MTETKADQVRTELEQIVARSAPGDRITGERGLAKQFDVDRSTVRTALSGMVSAGMITKSRSGYHVSESPITYELVEAQATDRHKDREQPSHYVVTLYAGRPVACTCRAFVHSNVTCKHMTVRPSRTLPRFPSHGPRPSRERGQS